MKIPVQVITTNGQDQLRQWHPAAQEWQYRDLTPEEAVKWRKAIADSAVREGGDDARE